MKTSTITKTLGLLALLGSSAGMAATVDYHRQHADANCRQQFHDDDHGQCREHLYRVAGPGL